MIHFCGGTGLRKTLLNHWIKYGIQERCFFFWRVQGLIYNYIWYLQNNISY